VPLDLAKDQRALMNMKTLWAAIFVILLCLQKAAFADVTVIQELDFGQFIVKNNDAQHDITINPGGVYSFSGAGLVEISPPEDGIYDIDGLPPNSVITSINITQLNPLQGVTGEVFQMVNMQSSFSSTNGSGVARIGIGGTARTSGNGNPYADQTYNGILQIQINF
jgi:hypothetical protein